MGLWEKSSNLTSHAVGRLELGHRVVPEIHVSEVLVSSCWVQLLKDD